MYNLCHVLGAKYQEKRMTRKATHLLCMVGDGEKYEAALRWGIEVVTADWVHACVAQVSRFLMSYDLPSFKGDYDGWLNESLVGS